MDNHIDQKELGLLSQGIILPYWDYIITIGNPLLMIIRDYTTMDQKKLGLLGFYWGKYIDIYWIDV